MLTAHLMNLATKVLAGPTTPSTPPATGDATTPDVSFNSSGIIGFCVKEILPIGIVTLGLIIVFRAKSGQVSRVMTSSGIAMIGMILIAGAGVWLAFGDNIVKIIVH